MDANDLREFAKSQKIEIVHLREALSAVTSDRDRLQDLCMRLEYELRNIQDTMHSAHGTPRTMDAADEDMSMEQRTRTDSLTVRAERLTRDRRISLVEIRRGSIITLPQDRRSSTPAIFASPSSAARSTGELLSTPINRDTQSAPLPLVISDTTPVGLNVESNPPSQDDSQISNSTEQYPTTIPMTTSAHPSAQSSIKRAPWLKQSSTTDS